MSRAAQQVVEVLHPPGDPGVGARVVQHLHAEPRGAAGDRLSDAAVPHDPERGAVDVDAQEVADVEAGPASGAEVGLGVGGPPARGEDQEEGEVGGGLVEHPGRVAHRDPQLRRGGDVDVVVADRDVGNDLQPRRAGAAGRRRRCGR